MSHELFNLGGRTAFVTGASGGPGAHFAKVLASAGAEVVLAARRERELETVAAEIRAAGGTCTTLLLDVTSAADIAPGDIGTDINSHFWESEAGKTMIKRIPQRRLGRLEDLDGALLRLASDASRYMTGSVITVDGGHVASSL